MSLSLPVPWRAGSLLLLGALALPLPALSQTQARILVRGAPSPGAEVEIQVELSWDGRPERLLPRVPSVEVPDGGALRLGTTGSRFDGDRSVWWTHGAVTLPDRGGPWTIGPAKIPVVGPDGAVLETFVAPRRTLGKRYAQSLLGQALASSVVLALALGLGILGWRRLVRDGSAPSPVQTAARTLQEALARGDGVATLDAAIALHDVLAAHPVAGDYVGDRRKLETAQDEMKFGGASPGSDALGAQVAPLLAIAGALE